MKQAVGIMGGTFDPIHFGHLAAAEAARTRFRLSRVIFLPNRHPPHKPDYLPAPPERRCDMVLLATASNPDFAVSRLELDRPGPSYSVDTLAALAQQLGPDTQCHFILGADAVLDLLTWRDPERLAQTCRFLAVSRPGYDLARLHQALTPDLLARTDVLQVPGLDLSSTELRRRAASGESLRYLTPQAVVRYIAHHRLYSAAGPPAADSHPSA
jgi:nicotinate-nucleotide adenylyltransferase